MIKKTLILLDLYFLQFTLLVCEEKNIFPNLTNSQEPEPGVFDSLEPEPLEKKPGAAAAWEKNQEPEPLEKKLLKKLPAPQPWHFWWSSVDIEIWSSQLWDNWIIFFAASLSQYVKKAKTLIKTILRFQKKGV